MLPMRQRAIVHIQQEAEAAYPQVYLKDEEHLLVPLFHSTGDGQDPRGRSNSWRRTLRQTADGGISEHFYRGRVLDSVEVPAMAVATLCFHERFLRLRRRRMNCGWWRPSSGAHTVFGCGGGRPAAGRSQTLTECLRRACPWNSRFPGRSASITLNLPVPLCMTATGGCSFMARRRSTARLI